jgi:hypothetical protein
MISSQHFLMRMKMKMNLRTLIEGVPAKSAEDYFKTAVDRFTGRSQFLKALAAFERQVKFKSISVERSKTGFTVVYKFDNNRQIEFAKSNAADSINLTGSGDYRDWINFGKATSAKGVSQAVDYINNNMKK